GEVSGYGQIVPGEGQLELRVAGSEAAVVDFTDLQLEAGSSQTLYLVGTPVEEVPLQPVIVENMAAPTMTTVPGAVGTPATSANTTFYRDTLTEIEARLAEIEGHLEQMQQVEGAQDGAEAALER